MCAARGEGVTDMHDRYDGFLHTPSPDSRTEDYTRTAVRKLVVGGGSRQGVLGAARIKELKDNLRRLGTSNRSVGHGVTF